MSLHKLFYGFIALAAVGSTVPALAVPPANNGGITVESNSNTVITGSGNRATNSTNQSVRNDTAGRTNGSPDITVRSNQNCDILGDRNSCVNRSTQSVNNRNRAR
jgi:hypothetical protein